MERPDCQPMMIGEVRSALEHIQQRRAEQGAHSGKLQNMLEFCQRFDHIKTKEMAVQLRQCVVFWCPFVAVFPWVGLGFGCLVFLLFLGFGVFCLFGACLGVFFLFFFLFFFK